MPRKKIHSGYVSIVGRPSTGKSTFLNGILQHKVSIVSPHPQSTRNLIRGIYNTEDAQCVFIDTPGFYTSKKKVNKRLSSLLHQSLEGIDQVLYFVDATRSMGDEDACIQDTLKNNPILTTAVINKCDIAQKSDVIQKQQMLEFFPWIKSVFCISATTLEGVQALLDYICTALPIHEPYYPRDVYTDQDPTLRITEVIRHVCWKNLSQEIPHALYVEIQHSEVHRNDNKDIIAAELDIVIYVEQKSHIPIVVGKKGTKIRTLRESSEKLLTEIFPYPIQLHLQCKHAPKWRTDPQVLNDTMY